MKTNVTRQQVEETLNSLDNMRPAEVSPFFYTRLQAKMDQSNTAPARLWFLLARPAVTVTTLACLLLLNIAGIAYLAKNNRLVRQQAGIQSIAQEYDLEITTDKIYQQ